MFQKHTHEKGFTLIELMIVIAIIGILAAIAIPNFISYRNKSYCSAAETDANSIAGKIANYFSVATHTATPSTADLTLTLSNSNTASISGDPNATISITVKDSTTRCPTDYQNGLKQANNPNGYWSVSATAPAYTKRIAP